MRPEILYPLFCGIETIKGIGERSHKLAVKLFGDKIVDMLWHLPSGIIDRRYAPKIINAVPGKITTITAKVIEHLPPKTSKQPYKVIMADETAEMMLIFFKVYADSIKKNLPIGEIRVVSGKTESFFGYAKYAKRTAR